MKASSSAARRGFLASLALGAGVLLSGCLSPFSEMPPANVGRGAPSAPSEALGEGSVRVALILPLSGAGQGAAAAASMRNAAELALEEFQDPDIALIVKDDMGTAEGAREAARAAIDEGAEIILGPLFASAVEAAGSVARASNVPVIAFSTDVTVASRGVYLMGFLPQNEVTRVIEHAVQQGRRSVAALIPETVYGNVVEAQFREVAAQRGLRVAAVERYPAGQPQAAIARLSAVIGGSAPQADTLFIPETPDAMPALAQALQAAGFNPARVKPIGTGVWNDPSVLGLAALQGGWFAAPEQGGFQSFAQRYQARYGAQPVRIATLAYDAVSLAAALTRTQGSQRFAEPVLTNPSGFAGADGVFRFRADGGNDRSLAVLEVRNGSAIAVSPAPGAIASGT
jgi:branched-chain amino acid transport system substrate-binding protein